ncbi:MAG: hypothetical protein H9893_02330 [Candidatus Niameybacter stercoravium]|nr:hypothetical protein [Candidatus Niameybacter stercoravium]
MKLYHKIVIIVFSLVISIGGLFTIGGNIKTLAKTTWNSMKVSWQKEQDISGVLEGFTEGIETGLTESFWLKEKYIDLYGLVERLLGRTYIRDVNPSLVVVKDNHEQLQFLTFSADYTEEVEKIDKLNKILQKSNTPLLYVQTPLKIIEGFTQLPSSVQDWSTENTDKLLQALEDKGVDYLDLRQSIIEDGLNLEELFYKTDHHWTTPTAFWAMEQVVEKLESEYGMVLDIEGTYTDIKEYKAVEYPKSFLGSQGRRVGRFYAGVDDYTLLTPLFDTNYKVEIHKSDSVTTYEGDFEETMIKSNLLDENESVYTNRYAAYFGGDYPEVRIENRNKADGHKVLIIKDSFALPFSAFLSTMFAETRMLDLRYYEADRLESYIEDYNPDVVLFVYKSLKME